MIRSTCKTTTTKIENHVVVVIYWGIVKSRSVMHFKGPSAAQTELKKAKSKTFSGVQCRIAKYFSVATVLLPDDRHTFSLDSCHHRTNKSSILWNKSVLLLSSTLCEKL